MEVTKKLMNNVNRILKELPEDYECEISEGQIIFRKDIPEYYEGLRTVYSHLDKTNKYLTNIEKNLDSIKFFGFF
jgi:hypothetical protein